MLSKSKNIILTIAASDSLGMAGISVDVKTQQAMGAHSLMAVTANTAQNNYEVLSINPVDVIPLKEQLQALKDLPISVVKVGMICNIEQVRVIANFVSTTGVPLVLDPVLNSSSGFEFFKTKDIAAYVDILLPLCELITPNLMETSLLTRLSVSTPEEIELAAESMLLLGARNILVKGGHSEDEDYCRDYFASDEKCFWLSSKRQLTKNTRGTGCALASAIASCLAGGFSIYDAVVIGKMAINQGIRESYSVAEGKGPVSITRFPDDCVDLPRLTTSFVDVFNEEKFLPCDSIPLSLYPVVDRAIWLKKLLPAGVTTIQLRMKDLRGELLENEIKKAVEIARQYSCRLFINDYWQLAIKYGAYGVHLGQEDLETADINAIREAGLRLGLSSHCHFEVARASYHKPSYIACGPVYHTDTKKMPWIPQGVSRLSYWVDALDYPVVAIGGINQQRISSVAQTGVSGIAMITAITDSSEPENTASQFIELINTSK